MALALVVNFAAMRKRPKVLHPTIKSAIQYLPRVPPIGKMLMVSKRAVAEASRRSHALRKAKLISPAADAVYPYFRTGTQRFLIPHDEAALNKRSRQHEQLVADSLNSLLRSGELIGPPNAIQLGYHATSLLDWAPPGPATIKEALDALAERVTTGQRYTVALPINWGSPVPVYVSTALDQLASRVQYIEDHGSGGNADSVLSQLGGSGVRISGLQADADVDVAGVNDDEFNSGLSGWTTLGSLDTADSNGDIKSHLHLLKDPSGFQLDGIYKACPSIPFTVTLKVSDRIQLSGREAGLFLAEAVPGKLYTFGHTFDATWDSGVWTNRTTRTSFASGDPNFGHPNRYLRIVVASSTSITIQFSQNALIWTTAATGLNPLGGSTVGSVGIFITAFAADRAEGVFDWIRFA